MATHNSGGCLANEYQRRNLLDTRRDCTLEHCNVVNIQMTREIKDLSEIALYIILGACVGLVIGFLAGFFLRPDTIITIKDICPTQLP